MKRKAQAGRGSHGGEFVYVCMYVYMYLCMYLYNSHRQRNLDTLPTTHTVQSHLNTHTNYENEGQR
jgi:hypothetical protein